MTACVSEEDVVWLCNSARYIHNLPVSDQVMVRGGGRDEG